MNSAPYQDTQTVVSVFLLQQQQNSFSARLHRTLQHHVPFYYFMLAWITPCALQEPFLEHFHLSSLKANIHHTQERGRRRWPTSRSKPPSITLVLASPSMFPLTLFLFPGDSTLRFSLHPFILVFLGLFSRFLWATERWEEKESSAFTAF